MKKKIKKNDFDIIREKFYEATVSAVKAFEKLGNALRKIKAIDEERRRKNENN